MYSRHRMINPLLGVYYGIFTAVYIGLVVFLLILEHMGVVDRHLLYALTVAAFTLSVSIAVAAMTKTGDDFFVSGRRVPAGLNGLVLFVVSIGGAGLSGLFGAVFFLGVDSFALLFGVFGGVILTGLMMASFVRKAGIYTVPSFFEVRYRSRFIGVIAGLCVMLPTGLFALAELSIIKIVGPMILGVSAEISLVVIFVVAMLIILPGGVRSMGWAQCGLAIVVVLGLIIPLVIVSMQLTNLPIAQLTYGSLIDDIEAFKSVRSVAEVNAHEVWSGLFLDEKHAVKLPFLTGEAGLGAASKFSLMVIIALGIASMPALVMRAGVTSGVFQARKSYAWGAALIGLLILTLPAYGIFLRYMIFNPEMKIVLSNLPEWISVLDGAGFFQVSDLNGDGEILAEEILLSRDGAFVSFPFMAGLNGTMQSLCFATIMAAALASFCARVMTFGKLFAFDLNIRKSEIEADVGGQAVMIWTRIVVFIFAGLAAWLVYQFDFDPFQLFFAGLIVSAAALFPSLLLSIWWRRMNKTGLFFSLLTGVVLSAGGLFVTNLGAETAPYGLDLVQLGCGAVLCSFLVGIIGALIGPKPTGADLEMLTEIRTPGGEAVYDRMLRLAMPRRTNSSG